MRLARNCATHLTRKAVAIEHKCACLFRERPCIGRTGIGILKEILAGLQIAAVVVSKNLIAFLVSQLPDAPSPLAGIRCFP